MPAEDTKQLKYVEDPEAVRIIREIGRRWPTIAEAADHPLTEFFIRSGSRDSILAANGTLLFCGLIFVCCKFNSFLESQCQRFGHWCGIAIIVITIAMIIQVRKKKRRELSWKKLLFSKEDKNRWVWLSGLKRFK